MVFTTNDVYHLLSLVSRTCGVAMSNTYDNAEYIARLTQDYEMYLKSGNKGGDWSIKEFMKALNQRATSILTEASQP